MDANNEKKYDGAASAASRRLEKKLRDRKAELESQYAWDSSDAHTVTNLNAVLKALGEPTVPVVPKDHSSYGSGGVWDRARPEDERKEDNLKPKA